MSVFLANIQKVANIRHPLTLSLMSPLLRSLFLSPSLYLSSLSIHSPSISLSLHALREKRLSQIVAMLLPPIIANGQATTVHVQLRGDAEKEIEKTGG